MFTSRKEVYIGIALVIGLTIYYVIEPVLIVNKTAEQARIELCQKYGHKFSLWKYQSSDLKGLLDYWKRECKICGITETRDAISAVTPDATGAMVLVAKEQAKIVYKEMKDKENSGIFYITTNDECFKNTWSTNYITNSLQLYNTK